MDTTRLATIYSGKSGVSSKLTRARNAVLGTYAHCSNVAILLDDKPYAMTGREEYVWEAQYTTHVTSLPFSRVFLNPISPGLAESPLRTPSAGPFHSVYGALPLLPFHCVYTRILERTWRRTAYTVPPALFPPSQCVPTVFLMGFDCTPICKVPKYKPCPRPIFPNLPVYTRQQPIQVVY